MTKKIELPVPEDFETAWELLPTDEEELSDALDGHNPPPFWEEDNGVKVYQKKPYYAVYASRDLKGNLWVLDLEARRPEGCEAEWVRHSEPGESQREALARIDALLTQAKQNMKEAVDIARAAGVRLYLEEEFGCQGLTNVDSDGEMWETSYC